MPTDGDRPPPEAADADLESVLERLRRAEAEREQLKASLEHEAAANRRILDAHSTVEGRLAEVEGVLSGTEAVRARAEAERDELQRRLTVELAASEQRRGEHLSAAEDRARALAELLETQAREADEARTEQERARAADAERITELEARLADELAKAAGSTEELRAELKVAHDEMRPRAARKLADAQAALQAERAAHEAERAARAELEQRVAALTESERALEQARARESEAVAARIADLDPALEQARADARSVRSELDGVEERLAASEGQRQEAERQHAAAVARADELARALAEAQDATGVLERALESVSGERDRTETARRVLEARLNTREEAEHAASVKRELERHIARAQRLQLTRVERRMAEISSGVRIAMRRLDVPVARQADVEAEAPAPAYEHVPEPQVAQVAEPERPRAEPAPQAPPATRTLLSGFLHSVAASSARPALEVAGETYDFAALHERAARIAATLQHHAPAADPPLTAVFAHRSVTAFAGVLGALMRGHGYVPLNRTLPVARTRAMFERAACQAIVADAASAAQLEQLLGSVTEAKLVLVPDAEDVAELRSALPAHRVLGSSDLEPAESWQAVAVDPAAIAYLLFTSDASGLPTGAAVTHRNALGCIDALAERYAISEHDRFSQLHDLTFDSAVFDVFVAWERGACVCCPQQHALQDPGRHIRDARLTVWLSLPSVAMFMRRLGRLKAGSYPDLRWSLFAGEPLPVSLVRAWQQAAPRSTIEHLYGPAETTVGAALYPWDEQTSPPQCEGGILPIGHPLPGVGVLIADDELREVAPGEAGELLVSGPQVSPGYWRDPARTATAYVTPPHSDAVHYRTGDLVRRPLEPGGPIVLLGRRDDQVKIRGERVELAEIESALRDACGIDAVAALGWPTTLVGADGVEA
ncbi:MAG: hypothetical protein QOI73_2304, partial [Solirubrobacteraceae bacterium]|nr:hypothetical protein [Solirubrobacteraceae bacterium]